MKFCIDIEIDTDEIKNLVGFMLEVQLGLKRARMKKFVGKYKTQTYYK